VWHNRLTKGCFGPSMELLMVKNITAAATMPLLPRLAPAGSQGLRTRDAQLKDAAHRFEAMFMSEMVHNARPENHGAGAFSGGKAEETWGFMMDQALGNAAASGHGSVGTRRGQDPS
jgi:Rod binding domain-containing protein